MAGEEELFELFEDLESQATALHDRERAGELSDRARAEYRSVTLDSRLMASRGRQLHVVLSGVGPVAGILERVGPHWFELTHQSTSWVVRTAAVTSLQGLSSRSVPEVAWGAVERLSFASALRRLAEEASLCVAVLADGTRHEGWLQRVGSDFVELLGAHSDPTVLPIQQLVAVRYQA